MEVVKALIGSTRNEKLSIQISRLLNYEDLYIVHFFYTMHIEKNVTKTLWRILDGRMTKKRLPKFVVTFTKPIMHCKV